MRAETRAFTRRPRHRHQQVRCPESVSDGFDEEGRETYGKVTSLLLFVALLVGGGLGLVRSLLLLVESLPLASEDLANLACYMLVQ